MSVNTLEELLVDQVRDLYDAEKQLVRALPKLAKNAHSDDLREALKSHLEETKNQVSRLEQVFEHLEKPAKSKPCKGMRGLIEEGSETVEEDIEENLSDLAIIAAAQRVEHYEISGYGTARTMAEKLGQDEVASLLEETEEEEKAADSKLTEVASALYEEARSLGKKEEEGMEMAEAEQGRKRPARAVATQTRSRRAR